MKEEYKSLQANKTWTLVQPSFLIKVIGNKWVSRIKYNSNGSISRYMASFAANVFLKLKEWIILKPFV